MSDIDEQFKRDLDGALAEFMNAVATIRTAYTLTAQDIGMTAPDKWAAYCTHAILSGFVGQLSREVGDMLDDTYGAVRDKMEEQNDRDTL